MSFETKRQQPTGGTGGSITIGDVIVGGTAKEILYTDNSGNIFSDNKATRDSITKETIIGRVFVSDGVSVQSRLLSSPDVSMGGAAPSVIPGTVVQHVASDGDSANMGVFDFFDLFGGSHASAGVLASGTIDGDDVVNNLLIQPGSGAWLSTNETTGEGSQIVISPASVVMTHTTAGAIDTYGHFATPGGVGWNYNSLNVFLPDDSVPTVGDVLTVAVVAGSNVQLVFSPGTGGGVGGSNKQMQFNDSSVIAGATLVTWDKTTKVFKAGNQYISHISPAQFNGSGVNDLTDGGTYTGTVNKIFKIEIDGAIQTLTYINQVGGTFSNGDTVTGSVTTASGIVQSDDGAGNLVVRITNGIMFNTGDVIDNGGGVTADWDTTVSVVDTFSIYMDNVIQTQYNQVTGAAQAIGDGINITFATTNGHTLTDYWTIFGTQFQNTWLTNNEDMTAINDGEPATVTGSVFVDTPSGTTIYNGIIQAAGGSDMPLPGWGVYRSSTNEIYVNGFTKDQSGKIAFVTQMADIGTGDIMISYMDNAQWLVTDINGFGFGINVAGSNSYAVMGDSTGSGNGTVIKVDDFTQLITVSNVPVYADDAAATGAGLTTGQLYKTTTGGSTLLKIVP